MTYKVGKTPLKNYTRGQDSMASLPTTKESPMTYGGGLDASTTLAPHTTYSYPYIGHCRTFHMVDVIDAVVLLDAHDEVYVCICMAHTMRVA